MIGLFFRRLALAVLFVAGVASIMATSGPPPGPHFREVEIWPAYRCPGTDVAVRWELNQPAPVSVAVGETELVTTAGNWARLPAELLEHNVPVATLLLRIEAEGANWPGTREIMTLGSGRTIKKWALHTKNNEFTTQSDDWWDERVRTLSVTVGQVRRLACADGKGYPPAWEVSPPSGPSFVLRAENNYSAVLDPPPPPGGEWRFRSKGGDCRPLSSESEVKLLIRFIATCFGAGGTS